MCSCIWVYVILSVALSCCSLFLQLSRCEHHSECVGGAVKETTLKLRKIAEKSPSIPSVFQPPSGQPKGVGSSALSLLYACGPWILVRGFLAGFCLSVPAGTGAAQAPLLQVTDTLDCLFLSEQAANVSVKNTSQQRPALEACPVNALHFSTAALSSEGLSSFKRKS